MLYKNEFFFTGRYWFSFRKKVLVFQKLKNY